MARTESRDQYESARSKGGSASPNSTISSISCSSSSCGSTGSPTSSRAPDPRFSAGSTTRSTYRDVSAHTDEARQRPVVPASNLRMEGDFHRSVSSREHFRNAGLYSRYALFQPNVNLHSSQMPTLVFSRTPAMVRKPMIPKASGKSQISFGGGRRIIWRKSMNHRKTADKNHFKYPIGFKINPV